MVENLDVQAKSLHFLDKHLEGFRNARLRDVVALNNCFVDLDSAKHIVGLDREQFLQAVSGAVCLECPHFHLTKALATELGLTPEWLLGDHGVWTG